MLEDESAKLERWRREMQLDRVTGLMTREPFMDQLKALLARDDDSSSGVLVMFRVSRLQELNRIEGRQQMDRLLGHIGRTLLDRQQGLAGSFSAHLNGSDFALVAPGQDDAATLAKQLHTQLGALLSELALSEKVQLPTAAGNFQYGEQLSGLLSQVDAELANAEQSDPQVVRVASSIVQIEQRPQAEDWQQRLESALAERRFELQPYPVVATDGELLHQESPVRLVDRDSPLSAGAFMPWLKKFNGCARLDLIVVEQAIELAAVSSVAIGINLSTELLSDRDTMLAIAERLRQHPEAAARLWLELPESGVYPYLEGFRTLCHLLKPLGCKLGVEHVGPNVAQTGALHDLGLDYLKIDGAFTQGVDQHPGNQIFLRGLCTIAHSIGLLAIAEQVTDAGQWEMLKELGIDGGTGPFFGSE